MYGLPDGETEAQAVARLLEDVRLPASFARRFPHELSGGQKQRVAIARAFAHPPELVICDEITAALDVSVQATVIELLLELRRRYGTAYLFITHDLNLIRQIAHRVAVMYRGIYWKCCRATPWCNTPVMIIRRRCWRRCIRPKRPLQTIFDTERVTHEFSTITGRH